MSNCNNYLIQYFQSISIIYIVLKCTIKRATIRDRSLSKTDKDQNCVKRQRRYRFHLFQNIKKSKVVSIFVKRPKILVLGAGYGGLTTVVNLQKSLSADQADIVLINKNDYHYESTWLHEVAAGTLSPEQGRYDIKSCYR